LRAFQGAAERLKQSGIAEKSLKVGDTAPAFTLPNVQGRTVDSTRLLKNGPLAISFYRGSWCPYCNLELVALQRSFPELKDIGAQLVAISPEKPEKAEALVGKHGLSFEVLSDAGNKVARQFGLVFTLDQDLQPFYLKAGNDLPAYNGDESWEIPLPASYVVDQNGTIVHAFVDPDYTKRLEPSEILKAVKEMIFLTLKK
jgi:peroxiredoxin